MFSEREDATVADRAGDGSASAIPAGPAHPGSVLPAAPVPAGPAIDPAKFTVGPIIPPSVPMIIVGSLSGISVGQMFIAGALPGILMGLAMMVTCYIISRRRNFPRQEWQGWGEVARSFGSASWALAMTGIIIYGLLSGLATPTETAIVASVYALHVAALGPGVDGLAMGDLVAVNPSHSCGDCRFCCAGLPNQCLRMTFLGLAMYLPHAQGLLRDRVTVGAAQCVRVPGDATVAEAACAEPLAVCLHAARMAGESAGKRVLVTGAGPIGALCTAVASAAGAAEIVATDIQDAPLAVATRLGAHRTINVSRDAAALDPWKSEIGAVRHRVRVFRRGPRDRAGRRLPSSARPPRPGGHGRPDRAAAEPSGRQGDRPAGQLPVR